MASDDVKCLVYWNIFVGAAHSARRRAIDDGRYSTVTPETCVGVTKPDDIERLDPGEVPSVALNDLSKLTIGSNQFESFDISTS